MTFEFKVVDRPKLYMSIVAQILEGIRSGAYVPGGALPTERLLAERFGVSRTSVREALRVLEHAGIVDVRTGSGSYVTDTALSSPALLRAKAAVEGDVSPLDVVIARQAVEPACAEQAALNRKERDLTRLRSLALVHEGVVQEGGDPREIDISFHLAVGEATGNPALADLMHHIAGIMRHPTWQHFTDRSRRKPGRPEKNLVDHRAILDAIERGDGSAAREAVLQHLADVQSSVLAEASPNDTRTDVARGQRKPS
jgi:DNA-binding FadR family transcriptional regulator